MKNLGLKLIFATFIVLLLIYICGNERNTRRTPPGSSTQRYHVNTSSCDLPSAKRQSGPAIDTLALLRNLPTADVDVDDLMLQQQFSRDVPQYSFNGRGTATPDDSISNIDFYSTYTHTDAILSNSDINETKTHATRIGKRFT